MDIIDEIYLSNYKNFVKVDHRYYGGKQRWLYTQNLRRKFWADRSCGVVAVANTLIHMSSYNPSFKGIYEYMDLSKENFIKFTNDIYNHIKPAIHGVHTLNKLNKGVQSFVRTKGFTINSKKMSRPQNTNSTVQFIRDGLMDDHPILILTWNSKIKNLRYHWVTITGYYKTVEGKNFIITSNWGTKQIFSLDDWLENKSFYKGLIYFY